MTRNGSDTRSASSPRMGINFADAAWDISKPMTRDLTGLDL